MAFSVKGALWLVAAMFMVASNTQAEPPVKPKAKIEFRWLSAKPIDGVTDEKGIRTTCGPELMYPYAKPVLTHADVAGTFLKKHDFTGSGLGEQYSVEFRLTGAGLNKLVNEAGDRALELAVFVDGRYWGATCFRKAETNKFTPMAGFMASKVEAERIVEACK